MSLVDRMVSLNARLQAIPDRLGVPQIRNLMVRHVSLDSGLLVSTTDSLFAPKPYIQNVPSRLVGLEIGGNITVRDDDFQVTGIPRSYSQDFLQKDVQYYVIDPLTGNSGEIIYDNIGNPAQGVFCKLLQLRDNELLTWNLILRRMADQYDVAQSTVDY